MERIRKTYSTRTLIFVSFLASFLFFLILSLIVFKTQTAEHEGNAVVMIWGALAVTMLIFTGVLFVVMERFFITPIRLLSGDVANVSRERAGGGIVSAEYAALCDAIADMRDTLDVSQKSAEQSDISINVLKSILNGMDAYLYVSDPVTDEILFINDKMKEHFGIDGGVGDTCWKVLQSGFTERCAFCPNFKLNSDENAVVVWEEHNTVTGHYYKNTDRLIEWTGGRLVHLQHSIDITDIKNAETALKKRLEQQELMSGISQSFISSEDMASLIDHALRMTGEFMGVDQIMMGSYGDGGKSLAFKYRWMRERNTTNRELIEQAEAQMLVHLRDTLSRNAASFLNLSGSEISKINRDAYIYGVKSMLVLPVYVLDSFWGAINFVKSDSAYTWSDSDIHLARLIANVIAGVIGRRRTEEQLLRMSAIVRAAPQYIAYADNNYQFIFFNPALAEITGYSEEELFAGGLPMLLSEETRRDLDANAGPALKTVGKYECELPLRRKSGETRIMSFSLFVVNDEMRGVAAIALDITERKKLEAELRAAKELAEESSKAKGEFLSRMSHEMRTPMNAIIGMTSIAKASLDPARKEYCIERIDQASKHLLGVINDILDMSKIEANKFELSFSRFNFERMLIKITDVIHFKIDEKQQNLFVTIAPDVPESIVGDEQRLIQVITNLMSNATKFTPDHGNIALTVSKTGEEGGLCTLQVEVRDSGIGISEEQIPKLFRSFEQADGGISRKFGGTGLGLAISKRIVELMGGRIWVESQPNVGSRFIFTFVAERSEPEARREPQTEYGRKDLRILVVDDSLETREHFLHLMETFGIESDAAPSGAEALRMIENASARPYHIVFTDWMMPGMDGVELAKRIRERAGHQVVIMISVAAWSDIEEAARAAGIEKFISKPLFPSQLMDIINDSIGDIGAAAPQVKSEGVADGALRGKVILLAEDIEINREIVVSLLEKTGVDVKSAEDGREALRMFSEDSDMYDLILMDVHMPEVDGYEATRLIRAMNLPKAKAIPIIAMTANVFREDVEKCIAAGMNDHIGKPVDREDMMVKLCAYLL